MGKGTKSIIVGVLAIVGFFAIKYGLGQYRIAQATLDEEIVYAYYQKQINAMRSFDAETQCRMMHPRFRSVDVMRSRDGEETVVLDRREACSALRESMDTMKAVVQALKIEPDMRYTIQSVTLSKDGRQATVMLRATLQIGKEFSGTSTAMEKLMRKDGDVYVMTSQSRTVVKER